MSRKEDLLTCLIPIYFPTLNLSSGEESLLPDCPYSHGPHAVLGWQWQNGEGHERWEGNEILSPIIRASMGWPATLLEPVIGISGGAPSLPRPTRIWTFLILTSSPTRARGFGCLP